MSKRTSEEVFRDHIFPLSLMVTLVADARSCLGHSMSFSLRQKGIGMLEASPVRFDMGASFDSGGRGQPITSGFRKNNILTLELKTFKVFVDGVLHFTVGQTA